MLRNRQLLKPLERASILVLFAGNLIDFRERRTAGKTIDTALTCFFALERISFVDPKIELVLGIPVRLMDPVLYLLSI